MSPQRIQRKRERGWRMPEGAVYVGRPSRWGNPFRVGEPVLRTSPLWPYMVRALHGLEPPAWLDRMQVIAVDHAQTVVDAYCWWLHEQPLLMLSLPELAGRDLACWCKPGQPCHADALLELANEGNRQ